MTTKASFVKLFTIDLNDKDHGPVSNSRRLIVGQVNTDKIHSDAVGKVSHVSSLELAKSIGGKGSMLASMYETFRKADPVGEVWCLPLGGNGDYATASLVLSGIVRTPGMLNLYIGGARVQFPIPAGRVTSQLLMGIVDKINNQCVDLPVVAEMEHDVITFVCKWQGKSGNDISMDINRLGRSNGEETPEGLVVELEHMDGGTGVPVMSTFGKPLEGVLGDKHFELICQPFSDNESLNVWKEVMADRWSLEKQQFGHVYSAQRGTVGSLVTTGLGQDDPHLTIMAMERGVLQPFWVMAAALTARTAVFISADCSRPTQAGSLPGIDPASASERFTLTERQSMLGYGIATAYYEGGYVRIQRAVSTLKCNGHYHDSEEMHQLAFIVRQLKSDVITKFQMPAGHRLKRSQEVVETVQSMLGNTYTLLELGGLVEQTELFSETVQVEQDKDNSSLFNVSFDEDYLRGVKVLSALNKYREHDAIKD